LILDADRLAAELVGDAHRGDVHFALEENLALGELGCLFLYQLNTSSASASEI
jgi:hypothetical protein